MCKYANIDLKKEIEMGVGAACTLAEHWTPVTTEVTWLQIANACRELQLPELPPHRGLWFDKLGGMLSF